MVGESLTLADIACGTALGYLELRFPENTWKQTYPNLNEFYARHVQDRRLRPPSRLLPNWVGHLTGLLGPLLVDAAA